MRSIRDHRCAERDTNESGMGDMDALMNKYSGKSEGELMNELMSQVSAAKRNGSFDAQSLEDFVNLVSPELDENSRQKLASLVKAINGELL